MGKGISETVKTIYLQLLYTDSSLLRYAKNIFAVDENTLRLRFKRRKYSVIVDIIYRRVPDTYTVIAKKIVKHKLPNLDSIAYELNKTVERKDVYNFELSMTIRDILAKI